MHEAHTVVRVILRVSGVGLPKGGWKLDQYLHGLLVRDLQNKQWQSTFSSLPKGYRIDG